MTSNSRWISACVSGRNANTNANVAPPRPDVAGSPPVSKRNIKYQAATAAAAYTINSTDAIAAYEFRNTIGYSARNCDGPYRYAPWLKARASCRSGLFHSVGFNCLAYAPGSEK